MLKIKMETLGLKRLGGQGWNRWDYHISTKTQHVKKKLRHPLVFPQDVFVGVMFRQKSVFWGEHRLRVVF